MSVGTEVEELEDEATHPRRKSVRRARVERAEALPLDLDGALAGRVEPAEEVEQRGLLIRPAEQQCDLAVVVEVGRRQRRGVGTFCP